MVNDFQDASSVRQSQRYFPIHPPSTSHHLKVSTPSTNSILDVPSTINCGCTSGATPIFTVRRESAYRPISRRSQALHRRSSFIRQIPSSFCNNVNSKKPSNLVQNQQSLYAKPSPTPAPVITFEQTYRGYASLRNHIENPIKVQPNILQYDAEQTVKIGTTRVELPKNDLDPLENLASPILYEYAKYDQADRHDVNNNVVQSANNAKNLSVSDRPKRPYKMTIALSGNHVKNEFSSDGAAREFTVMPAVLAYPPECRKKLRIRRRYQPTVSTRQCIVPRCEPQCHCALANQTCQIPLKACIPPFEADNYDQKLYGTQQICRRWRTGCTVRRRICTPVREPTPLCCFQAYKVPGIPPAQNASTGAGPFETQLNSITHPTPDDENIQSFTPIKSSSTSSTALKQFPSAKSAHQEESLRNFQPYNLDRGLVGRSKSTPSIQPSGVTFHSQNLTSDSNQNITGTRGKSTKQSEKQIRQIYPPQSSSHRPIMAQQATSYSGDKIQDNSSIKIGPPSKIPPFSDATAAYPLQPDSPPTTGSSPGTQVQFNARPSVRRPPSALKSNIKSSSSSKSTRFRSVVQRGSAAMPLKVADELPNIKGSLTRRPTAYPSSKAIYVRSKGSHDRRPTGYPSEKGSRSKYLDESDAFSQDSTQNAMQPYESIIHPPSTNSTAVHPASKNESGIMHHLSRNLPADDSASNHPHVFNEPPAFKGKSNEPPAFKGKSNEPTAFKVKSNEPPAFKGKSNVTVTSQGPSNTAVPFSQQSFQKQMHGQPTRPHPDMENPQRKEPFESYSSNYSDRTTKFKVAQPASERAEDVNYGRPTSLPPKPEPRPPLPPKPHKTGVNIPRPLPSWRPGGHSRKKRPKKKAKGRDSSYADASDGLVCGNMLPLGCFPCGPTMLPHFQAKEAHSVKPDTQNCCQIMSHMTRNGACKPIIMSPMPTGAPQLGFNIPQVCIGPSPNVTEGINGKFSANVGMPNLNSGNNGQNTSKPVVTIIPGMVYAPAAAVRQAYGDKLNCWNRHVTGGWKS